MFPFTQTRKESANAWVNVYMESDHSHTAYRIRMPQPQSAYAYRVYGILALVDKLNSKIVILCCPGLFRTQIIHAHTFDFEITEHESQLNYLAHRHTVLRYPGTQRLQYLQQVIHCTAKVFDIGADRLDLISGVLHELYKILSCGVFDKKVLRDRLCDLVCVR